MTPTIMADRPALSWELFPAERTRELLFTGEALTWLSPAEAAAFDRFKIEKRRLDWLAGRLAAKRAIMAARPGYTAPQVEILTAPEGKPFARLPEGAGPEISIAHSAAGGICAVSADGSPVGVDLETLGTHGLATLALFVHPSEVMPAGAEPALWQTKLWTAKEAVLKLFGVGFAADPREVRWSEERNILELDGAALRRWTELGKPRVTVEHARVADSLIAFARCGG
jgi:phosphopantetheinyl transferase